MVGTTIGNYQVLQLIGAGGMGAVFEAVQQPIGRRVAIKVLHPEFAHDREVLKRFFNEARAANLISHPSIVQVSDYGQLPNGSAYLVMEFLNGATLDERLEASGGCLSSEEAQHITWQLASALAAAHAAGIVHRDLKPSNIMLIPDAIMPGGFRVKILDFGVAKLGQSTNSSHKTRTGAVLGTPTYMAPEQCIGAEQVDGKADVYALGILLFQSLAGAPPFSAPSDLAILNMQVSNDPPSLQQRVPTVPSGLAELVRKMLRKNPAERPSMNDVASSLQRFGATQSLEHLALASRISGNLSVVDPVAPTHPRPKWSMGTLASGIGQKLALSRINRRLLSIAAVMVSVALLIFLARKAITPTTASVAAQSDSMLPHDLKAVVPEDGGTHESSASTIELDSTPPGAQIFDAEGERLIGQTPWTSPIPVDGGDVWLLLRMTGYHDRVLRIKPRAGVSIQRHEVLVPIREDRKHQRTATKRQPLKIDDVKKRFFSNPDGGGQVDIPDSYRIVD